MSFEVAIHPDYSPAKNKAEIDKALASYDASGGEVRLPWSPTPFLCDPLAPWPAQRNLVLVGEGGAAAYEDGFAGTEIQFTAGAAGIDCSQIINDPARPYAVIAGVRFNGGGVCQQGIKAGGIMRVEDVDLTGFTQAGLHVAKLANSIEIIRVSAVGNANLGFWIGGEGEASNPNNTRLTLTEIRARSNLIGVRWEQAQGARVNGGVIESNYGPGMEFYRPGANRVLQDIALRDLWFEGNWRGADGYAVTIDGNGVLPSDIRFTDTHISVGGLSKAIKVTRLDGGLFENLAGSGAIDLEGNCQNVGLLDVSSGFTVSDAGTGNWQKSLSQIGSGSGGGGGGSADPLSLAKAWLIVDAAGNILDSFNIQSAQKDGTGLLTVSFQNGFASDNYIISPSCYDATGAPQIRNMTISGMTSGQFQVKTVNGAPSFIDPVKWLIVCFGRQ